MGILYCLLGLRCVVLFLNVLEIRARHPPKLLINISDTIFHTMGKRKNKPYIPLVHKKDPSSRFNALFQRDHKGRWLNALDPKSGKIIKGRKKAFDLSDEGRMSSTLKNMRARASMKQLKKRTNDSVRELRDLRERLKNKNKSKKKKPTDESTGDDQFDDLVVRLLEEGYDSDMKKPFDPATQHLYTILKTGKQAYPVAGPSGFNKVKQKNKERNARVEAYNKRSVKNKKRSERRKRNKPDPPSINEMFENIMKEDEQKKRYSRKS